MKRAIIIRPKILFILFNLFYLNNHDLFCLRFDWRIFIIINVSFINSHWEKILAFYPRTAIVAEFIFRKHIGVTINTSKQDIFPLN